MPDLEQSDIDLPEIQEIDPIKIIKEKLLLAEAHHRGKYIVEDTSLYLDCLGGKLPGPFIKWFEQAIGIEKIAIMAEQMSNTDAEAKTIIGYATETGETHFFEGALRGHIVKPRGNKDFVWGPIFQPENSGRTFGEMEREEKHRISMRIKAVQQLKDFLESKK